MDCSYFNTFITIYEEGRYVITTPLLISILLILIYVIYNYTILTFIHEPCCDMLGLLINLNVFIFLFILIAQCTDGTLDIINQLNPDVKDNGQLFICSNNTWFPLCSTNSISDATQAVCQQLGFVDGSKL